MPNAYTLRTHPWRLVLFALVTAFLGSLASVPPALAHAALDTSTPASGDVLDTSPTEITATFTEPLEQSYSRLQLFDSSGTEVEGTTLGFGDDGYSMTLALPNELAHGTWSVLWRTLSTADGHPAQNYFTFTIGTTSDIAPVTIPGTALDDGTVPQWAKTTSRWAALLGAIALIACWPVWSTVFRPALGAARRESVPTVRRMRRYVLAVTVLAALGSVYALLVQAMTLTDGTLLDKVVNTLGQTRYGHLWLARFGLIVGLGLVLSACGWWFTKRRQVEGILAWALSIALVLPFALISHASAQPTGRTVAIGADATHLFATSVWAGGLAMLVFVLFPGVRKMTPAPRADVIAAVVPRFSTLALIAMAGISITGFYAGWLQVGNLAALTETDYGKSLLAKLILFAVILVLAAVNLLVIDRRLRNRDLAPVWTRRLRWTVSSELVLIVLLLLAVGRMTSLQPARDVMVERARQVEIAFDTDPSTTLLLAPGVVGVNHFRLEVSGPALPADTEALLRLTIPANEALGTREIQLSRVTGNAFEYHGNEIGIAADWEFTVILRQPGEAQIQDATTVSIGATAPQVDVPDAPWRFETLGGLTGLALIIGGCAALIVALRSASPTTRKESAGLGGAAIILGVILLMQARIDPVLATATGARAIDPTDVAMVERGEAIYVAQCLACHGAELRGDGPDSAGMSPPPADFTAPHAQAHSESDLVYWVRNGKQGTAMPGFGTTLSDQDIRDVLSYIAAGQESTTTMAITPADPVTCTTEPVSMETLAALAGTGAMSPVTAVTPSGAGVDDQVTGDIELTVRQLLACTNGMDTWRRLGLFTDGYLATTFAGGIPAGFAETADTGAPMPMNQWLALVGIREVSRLEDGRVIATIEIDDPTGQFELPGAATASGTIEAQVIFAEQDGQWLIDGVITPPG